jgi:predicted HD phosphohydrolase
MTSGEIDELLAWLEQLADLGSAEAEGFTELDHGLQCALEVATARPSDVELQVAGLVHDIGHLFAGDRDHARVGAEHVRPLLGDRVASLVDAHVTAKRYLIATDQAYGLRLSEVSTATLGLQGGPLTYAERERFEGSAVFDDALLLRRADDAAKVPGRDVPGLDDWLPTIRRLTDHRGPLP